MDKQLEKEALEKYPKAWRHPTKSEQVAYFDPNEQKRTAYIAGATSSSTVKRLEAENRQLKNIYMELKADYDMLNEKYQQLSRPASVEEPPVESWGIKDIQVLTAQGELSTCKVAVNSSDEKLESTVKNLENQVKALSAIKRGLEKSLTEALDKIGKQENKDDWKRCRCDNPYHYCFVHHQWGKIEVTENNL